MSSYTSATPWTNQFNSTLLIACSDGRFGIQLDNFCKDTSMGSCDRFLPLVASLGCRSSRNAFMQIRSALLCW